MDKVLDIAIFIHPMDTNEMLRKFQKKVAEVQSQISTREQKGMVRDPMLDTAYQDLEKLRDSLQQAQERVAELTAVYESSQRLIKLHTPQTLAREIIGVLEGALAYEYAAVLLIDDSNGRLVPFALSDQARGPDFVESDKAHIASRSIQPGVGITGRVAETGQSARLGDVRQDPRYFAMRDDIRSELCVPLRAGEKVIGAVNIETTKPDAYTESDQRVLETVAAQIAIAIQIARLLEQVRVRADEFAALYDTARALTEQHDLNRLLLTVTQRASTLFSVPDVAIYLYDSRRGDLALVIDSGASLSAGTRLKVGDGMAGRVAQSRQPLVVAIGNRSQRLRDEA